MTTYWRGLCGDHSMDWAFWSTSVAWDTPRPDLTLCFQMTVLQWVPCAFLWVGALFYLPCLRKRARLFGGKVSRFNLFKQILCIIVGFLSAMDFVVTISDAVNGRKPPPIEFLQPCVAIITLVLCGFIMFYEYIKGVHSSGLIWFFWFFDFICRLAIFISQVSRIANGTEGNFRSTTAIIGFVVVAVLLVSCSFADRSALDVSSDRGALLSEYRPLLSGNSTSSDEEKGDGMSEKSAKPSPEISASFLSRFVFMWMTPMLITAYRRALTAADMYDLLPCYTSKNILARTIEEWRKQLKKATISNRERNNGKSHRALKSDAYLLLREIRETEDSTSSPKAKPSLVRAFIRCFGAAYLYSGLLKVILDMFVFLQPILLKYLINFISDPKELEWHGYAYAVALFLLALLRTLVSQHQMHIAYITGMKLRTAAIGLIYRKALKLSGSSKKDTTVGQVVNLMSVDSQILQDAPSYLHYAWTAPIIFAMALYLLWLELGPSALAGLAVMILLLPVNAVIASKSKKFQFSQLKLKDQRIKLMSEILNGIKVLKLYAWENSFASKVFSIRGKEVALLRLSAYLNAGSSVTWFCAPFLVACSTFALYVLSSPEHVLTSQKAFVSLTLFGLMNAPLTMLPGVIAFSVQLIVSFGRINKYLIEEELDPSIVEENPMAEEAISVENGTFSWTNDGENVLKNINFSIPDGKLYAVVGAVGSGKTSLVSAILGELVKRRGRVIVKGKIAYVPQQAWCQNCSLQDNILFGRRMNHQKYQSAINACALGPDLKVLAAGDQTEIGEKGINLSGGQKQRVSMARAVYHESDIYLLDDPLSAVDSHVGRHIFDKVISEEGLLAGKTRVLVTHGLSYLPKVDCILVMKDGVITESGTYQELLSRDGPFAEYLRAYFEKEDEEEDDDPDTIALKESIMRTISVASGSDHELRVDTSQQRRMSSGRVSHHRKRSSLAEDLENLERQEKERQLKARQKLMTVETAETGSVKLAVFIAYIKAIRPLAFLCIVVAYMLYITLQVSNSIWLSRWSEDTSTYNDTGKRDLYLGVYGALGVTQSLCVLIQSFALAIGTYSASMSLHRALLNNVLRTPMSFFDTTPLGRIVNRFGKDIDTVDINIPLIIRIWMITLASVIGTLFIVTIASPLFLIALIPLGVCYYFAQRFYICTSRQLKRIDSVKRSPIYSHFQESIVGASSIRSYNRHASFIAKSDRLVDENQMVWYPNLVSYRWMGILLETIGSTIILLAGVLAVVTRDSIGPGLAGASVSYALQVTSSLNYTVRMTCDLETYIVAVERIQEYAGLKTEAALYNPEEDPDEDWPQRGEIELENYAVRYRPGLDRVLKNISATINAGEKVGIVGRTGAGKSSLTLALFRLLEPDAGRILLDGVDTSRLGLHSLRSRLTIIPQEPVLFSGSLRMNLDPFETHSDGQVWRALEQAHLKEFVSGLPEGLQHACTEGGDNLSVGQRQLVCLARALLRKTRVLVLDEATAAVDLETDDLIQNTIRREFKDCTILTIAHRLNTIMDYDRIMVLDHGQLKEFASPKKLLQKPRSIFYGMCRDAGLV